jgi:hypothetical protein
LVFGAGIPSSASQVCATSITRTTYTWVILPSGQKFADIGTFVIRIDYCTDGKKISNDPPPTVKSTFIAASGVEVSSELIAKEKGFQANQSIFYAKGKFNITYKDSSDSTPETRIAFANASVTATGATANRPPSGQRTVGVSDVVVSEPQIPEVANAVFRVRLSKAADAQVRVPYHTEPGSATSPADFQETSGTAVIPAGSTFKSVRVPINTDADQEPNEQFSLILGAPSGPAVLSTNASGVATILPPQPRVYARSDIGDPWSDAAGNTGRAVLTYGHLGCPSLDSVSHCQGGSWVPVAAGRAGAPYIWKSKKESPAEASGGTANPPLVFEKKFSISTAREVTIEIAGDDTFTIYLNGTLVASASGTFTSPATYTAMTQGNVNVLRIEGSNMAGSSNPDENPAGLAYEVSTR